LVLGAGFAVVGCGAEGETDHDDPVPGDVCAAQHVEGSITVCDELYAEAPYVHLPAASATRVFAGLQGTEFIAADGTTYPYGTRGSDPEEKRHAVALYELELEGKTVTSFRPVLTFAESVFVKPFMGRAFEGAISRRLGDGFAEEASLPVRVEILDEVLNATGASFEARALVKNLEQGVTAADGSCLPPLTSYGEESPFDAGAEVTLEASRSPWMHGVGDDVFVIDVLVDGSSIGSMMAPAWYRGPIDLVRDTLAPTGRYDGFGHGSPGSIPSLSLELAEGGGKACTAP
jgi:hypothetical protein